MTSEPSVDVPICAWHSRGVTPFFIDVTVSAFYTVARDAYSEGVQRNGGGGVLSAAEGQGRRARSGV